MVSIFYLSIFLILHKTQQRQAFWMTPTRKNLIINKFFGKIGQTLFANLAYLTLHHLKSIYRTLRSIYHKKWKMSVFGEFKKIINFITNHQISIKKQQSVTCCFWLNFILPNYISKSIWNENLAPEQFFYNRRSFSNIEPTLMEGPEC